MSLRRGASHHSFTPTKLNHCGPLKPLDYPRHRPMQGITTPMSSFSHSHRRKHSGELDVFEATRYFSGDVGTHEAASRRATRTERISLDMPIEAKVPQRVEMNHIKEKIKCKQPSSPGGKLASFLNSFFQQYSSKKKPSKSVKGEEDQRRKRRSSISNSNCESKSCYYSSSSCSTSGFRTPSLHSKKRELGFKMRLGDELNLMKKDKEKEVGGDDGGESDSSSDLFEIKINYEFGGDHQQISSGLPVYGSTDMGVIGRGDGFASTVAF